MAGRQYGAYVIDTHKGSEAYEGAFQFDRVHAPTAEHIENVADRLTRMPLLRYSTVIIDSVTDYWQLIQDMWHDIYLKTKIGTTGHHATYYSMQPNDWQQLRRQHRETVRVFRDLPAHIIFIAQEKDEWEKMKVVGITPDCEKALAGDMDIILRINDGVATVEGSRIDSIKFGSKIPFTLDAIRNSAKANYFPDLPDEPFVSAETLKGLSEAMKDDKNPEKTKAKLVDLFGVEDLSQLCEKEAVALYSMVQARKNVLRN